MVKPFFKIKDIRQETSSQNYRWLAILLFVDWVPQVNGFTASLVVYHRESILMDLRLST